MPDYDVIVIGAGNGGLGASAKLAKHGAKVLCLEQHNLPGGFGSSFVRGRFEFETSLHILCDYGSKDNKGNVRNFLDDIGLKLELHPVPDAYRFVLEQEDIDVILPPGVYEYIETVESEAPGSREEMTRYFTLCKEVLDALNYLAESKGKPDKKILRTKYANFLKTGAYTAQEVTDKFNFSRRAKNLLYPYWLNFGPPMSRLNFTIWAAFLYKYMTMGGYLPKNRSHELMAALQARAEELGAEFRFNTKVEKILVKNGRVRGVETSDGETITAHHVICNASPTLAYNKLVWPRNEVPDIAYKYINARKHGVGVFVVYMGLDAPPEEIGLTTYGYVVGPHADTEKLYESFYKPEAPIIQATTCLNLALPGCSPPGTTILSMTCLMRPEAWANVRPEDYFETKTRMADELITQFERGTKLSIRKHIEEIEISTPETYARYTGTYNGIIYGYEMEPWDSVIPRMLSIQDEKYIDGLYFAGGFSFRALGYSSSLLSGQTTALLTLKEMGVEV